MMQMFLPESHEGHVYICVGGGGNYPYQRREFIRSDFRPRDRGGFQPRREGGGLVCILLNCTNFFMSAGSFHNCCFITIPCGVFHAKRLLVHKFVLYCCCVLLGIVQDLTLVALESTEIWTHRKILTYKVNQIM